MTSKEPPDNNSDAHFSPATSVTFPSAPPSYEEAVGYTYLGQLPPQSHDASAGRARSRSSSPFEVVDNQQVNQNVRTDHFGVIGYFQPPQPKGVCNTSDPYVVLTFPYDLIPKMLPKQKLNLQFLNW